MAGLNKVIIMGNLTADPELKTTADGVVFTRFTVAVDRRRAKGAEKSEADFIGVIAWRKTAEFICGYFSKGAGIAVWGELRTGSFTDGNGVRRFTVEVLADEAVFGGGYRRDGGVLNNVGPLFGGADGGGNYAGVGEKSYAEGEASAEQKAVAEYRADTEDKASTEYKTGIGKEAGTEYKDGFGFAELADDEELPF